MPLTSGLSLSTRDTVAGDNPASRATSRIVVMLAPPPTCAGHRHRRDLRSVAHATPPSRRSCETSVASLTRDLRRVAHGDMLGIVETIYQHRDHCQQVNP